MNRLDRYDRHRDRLQSGDCLAWRSNSVVGFLIRLFSRADINHVGLCIKPRLLGYFVDRRFTLEALGDGVVLRLLSERLRGFDGQLWLYPLKEADRPFRDRIITAALNEEGVGYDYWSLFKQIFSRVSADAWRYFCSEYCYMVYRDSGVKMPDMEKAPRPGDLVKLPIFKPPILIYDSKEETP